MRIAQYCLEKADIMERRKQGFKMQGGAGWLHILVILEPLFFIFPKLGLGKVLKTNERKGQRAWEERGTRRGTGACKDTLKAAVK